MCAVRMQRLALLPRFASEHWRAQHDVASRNLIVHEREHVGDGGVPAVCLIQGAPFGGIDEPDRDACVAVECGDCPSPKQGACRKIVARRRVLDAKREARLAHPPKRFTDCAHAAAAARACFSSCAKSGMMTASDKASRLSPT